MSTHPTFLIRILGAIVLGAAVLRAGVPAQAASPPPHPLVVMQTSKGLILIKLFPEDAPKSCANFIKLANSHFYDGTKIHRVADIQGQPDSGQGHVIQGGSPLSKFMPATANQVGGGGPGWTIKGEFPSNGVSNPLLHNQGAFAMAREQAPDTAGSQFYIVVTPAPSLNGKYAVFGQVIKGIDVANKLVVGDVIEHVSIDKTR